LSSPLSGIKLTSATAQKLLDGEFEAGKGVLHSVHKGCVADPNGKGLDGTTALMEVAKKGDVETVKVLLRAKANPSEQDAEGGTALHFAAISLHTGVVEALMAAQADPSLRDHAGFSAWMLVGDAKKDSIVGVDNHEALFKENVAREQILKMLKPKMDAEKVIEDLVKEGGWRDLVKDGADPEFLAKTLRLHESLYFNPLDSVERAPRIALLNRSANVMMDFLRIQHLKGDQKKLTKYLLQATMGPKYDLCSKHMSSTWTTENNRASYEPEFRGLVTELLKGFASECDKSRAEIKMDAEESPNGDCAALCALPADRVDVPEQWQQEKYWRDFYDKASLEDTAGRQVDSPEDKAVNEAAHWRTVQQRNLLRYDPAWAHGIRDGATMCLALLQLGSVDNLSEYSALLQVHHRPMAALMATGYLKFSDLCNEKFQERMTAVAQSVAERTGVNVSLPEEVIKTKQLKRLSEKMSEARRESYARAGGIEDWPGRSHEYLSVSQCFYILDTVRLSFICNGDTVQEQVAGCLQLLNGFKSCSLEKDGLQMLRTKSGFASNVEATGGYADVKLLVFADLGTYKAFDGTEIPLRIIGEVQLILRCYMNVKAKMHLAYEINRGSFHH